MTRRERPETLLDAVFLWIIPFLPALSMAEIASFSATEEPSTLLLATSSETFFERVLSFVLTDLFLSSCASACLALFMADMFFFRAGCADNLLPPYNHVLFDFAVSDE